MEGQQKEMEKENRKGYFVGIGFRNTIHLFCHSTQNTVIGSK
jgi:hypothetical protein